MVLINCTKNESNLANIYREMPPYGQNVWTDGWNGRKDGAKTISLRLRRGDKKKRVNIVYYMHQTNL